MWQERREEGGSKGRGLGEESYRERRRGGWYACLKKALFLFILLTDPYHMHQPQTIIKN